MDYLYLLIFSCLFAVVIYKTMNKYPLEERKILLFICILSFLIRVLIVLIAIIHPSISAQSDAAVYEAIGLKNAENWRNGIIKINIADENFSYYLINALVYFVFGFHPVILKIMNSLFGILAAINIYNLGKSVKGVNTARIASMLLAFYPSLIYYSALNLKDTLILFLITLIILDLIKIIEVIRIKTVIRIFLTISVLLSLRFYIGIFAILIFFCVFALFVRISLKKKIGILVGLVLFMGALLYKFGYGIFGIDLFKRFNLEVINDYRRILKEQYSTAKSNIFLDVNLNTAWEVLKFIPLGFIYFMFSPFPWESRGVLQLATVPENIVWYVLVIFFSWRGIIYLLKKENIRRGLVLFVFCAIIIAFYSLTMANIGIAYRMKFQVLPFFFLFIAIGMDLWKPNLFEYIERKLNFNVKI